MATPTLVVVGEHDPPCIGPSRFLAETITGARLEVIAGSGHSVNIEEPTTINRLVADFVNAAERKRLSRSPAAKKCSDRNTSSSHCTT